jgi:hypothetical protein
LSSYSVSQDNPDYIVQYIDKIKKVTLSGRYNDDEKLKLAKHVMDELNYGVWDHYLSKDHWEQMLSIANDLLSYLLQHYELDQMDVRNIVRRMLKQGINPHSNIMQYSKINS